MIRIISAAIMCVFITATVFAADGTARQEKATRLTAKFQSQGAPVVFKAVGKNKNIIQISQKNIVQEPPLTKGQITTLLGVYLKENTQADLKKLGFTSGIIVDGKSRRYDFHL